MRVDSVVEDHAQEATVDRQSVGFAVVDKAQLPELVYEMTYRSKMRRSGPYSVMVFPREIPAREASQSTGWLFLLDMTTSCYLLKSI